MPKATRKNTTPAKRAAPDPIVKLIDAADNALDLYRRAESNLSAAQDHMRSAADELERITKAMAKEKALALLPLNVLPDWAVPNRVAVQQYIDVKRRMDIVAHTEAATAGYFTADDWGGDIVLENVIFNGGPWGLRSNADPTCTP